MEWRFLHPGFLALLPLPLIWLVWNHRARHRVPALVYSGISAWKSGGGTLRMRAYALLPWIRTLALLLGIIALARPQYGQVKRSQSAHGIDISLVLDISETMDLPDFEPDRLEVAKDVLLDFVEDRPTDRLSVVVFGTDAYVLVPPTFDRAAIETFLGSIDSRTLPREQRMTAIGLGLARAVEKLKDSTAESRVVILLTDGENTAGNIEPLQAAEAARALGIRVYTIGVGSNQTLRIPVRNMFGMTEFKSVTVTLDEETLGEIAEMTGGRYYRATDEDALRDIYGEIDRLERTEIETNEFDDFNERFMWLWTPALFLLLGEFFLRGVWLIRLP